MPLGRAGPLRGLWGSPGGGSPASREQAEGDGCPNHLLHVGADDGDLDHEPEQHTGHLEGPGPGEVPEPMGGHSLQGGDPCPHPQAAAGHLEQHRDPRRAPPASPTTECQGAGQILNPSLPPPAPHPCASGSREQDPSLDMMLLGGAGAEGRIQPSFWGPVIQPTSQRLFAPACCLEGTRLLPCDPPRSPPAPRTNAPRLAPRPCCASLLRRPGSPPPGDMLTCPQSSPGHRDSCFLHPVPIPEGCVGARWGALGLGGALGGPWERWDSRSIFLLLSTPQTALSSPRTTTNPSMGSPQAVTLPGGVRVCVPPWLLTLG